MLKVTTTITDTGGQSKAMVKELKKIARGFVTIGVHEDAGSYTDGPNPPTVAEVALWNEFGTTLSPERSFMRSAIDENDSLLSQWREELLGKVVHGQMTARKALEAIGFRVQQLIQNKIKSNVPPPNAPSTIARKQASGILPKEFAEGKEGETKTLINTGLMLRSVAYKVTI